MMGPITAIARSTFTEIIRQPFYALILSATLAALALSPSLAMFSLGQDEGLLLDFGASTLLLAGLLIAAFGAATVLGRELEGKTAAAVLAKPVSRGEFLLGKLLGVLCASAAALYLSTLAYLLAARARPSETARDPIDGPVVAVSMAALAAALAAGAIAGARSPGRGAGRAASVKVGCAVLSAGVVLVGFLDPAWSPQPFWHDLHPCALPGAMLALLGVVLLGGVAMLLAVAAPRGVILGTLLVFLAGIAASGSPWALGGIVPDLQVFWIGEAFYGPPRPLPAGYIASVALYSTAYAGACLTIAAILLERREVG